MPGRGQPERPTSAAHAPPLFAIALPIGLVVHSHERGCFAMRRETGEIVVMQLCLPQNLRYAPPSRPLRHARWRLLVAARLWLDACRLATRQRRDLATANIGGEGLAGLSQAGGIASTGRTSLQSYLLGLVAGPLLFALEPLWVTACGGALPDLCALRPHVAALLEAALALAFVPLYVQGLRCSASWRATLGYHAAGHALRAQAQASERLPTPGELLAHAHTGACTAVSLPGAALLAALTGHVGLAAGGAHAVAIAAWLRAIALGPAIVCAAALTGTGAEEGRAGGGQQGAGTGSLWGALVARWSSSALRVAPSVAMCEVATCALGGLQGGATKTQSMEAALWTPAGSAAC